MPPWSRWTAAFLPLFLAAVLAIPPGVAPPVAHDATFSPLAGGPIANGGPWVPLVYREPGIGLGVGPAGPAPALAELSITLTLPFSNPRGLGGLLSGLDDPSSPSYRDYLTASQFDAEFGGSPDLYRAWVEYAQGAGATQLSEFGDRSTLSFEATPAVAGAIFHTSIRLSQDAHGRPFYAPTSPPEVLGSLAAAGEYVDGLSSYPRYLIGTDGAGAAAHPTLRPLAHRSASVDGYPAPVTLAGVQEQFASDYQVAYDQLSLYQQFGYPTDAVAATILWSGNYTGATVTTPYGTLTNNEAVGPFDPNDVDTYYNETLPTGEPHPTVYGAPLDGAPLPGPLASWDTTGSAFENTLDLEDLGALAPGATIYNVYAPWASYAGLDQAFAYVLSPNATTPALANVSVISNSWGSPEINDTGWYQDLQEAQVRGITVLAISGDSGDSPASSWGVGDAFYPGSMAYDNFGDVAVGGTTNTLSTTTLSLLHQRAWYDGSQPGGPVGSTGGVSGAFSEPSWQSSTSAGAVIGGAGRGVPDVAALANNSLMTFTIDGYQYQATNASVNSNYYYSWGTSIATPVEAGVVADIDHVLRAPSNRWMNRPLGFFDPSMYRLASEEDASLVSNSTVGYFTGPSYASRLPTLPLTDVTTGGNDRYAASTGYDLVTGWGAIDAYNLTMYYLALPGNSTPGQWEAVRASMNLTDLVVTSSYPGYGINTAYNASIQQNFFVANSLGAPVYWVQNVVYIYGVPGDWQMNFTGWLVYPFYGVEGTLTMFEYNVPIRGVTETPPVNFTLTTQLTLGADFDQQEVQYSFGTPGAPTLTLPIPGAAYIIGNLSYNYSWQGVEYSDGPYPAPYGGPGGLAPQFGLVGGPSGFIGNFGPGTAGSVQLSFSWGGPFLPGLTRSFGASIDQTGEAASNLTWTETSPGNASAGVPANWTFGYQDGSVEQGILETEPATLPSWDYLSVNELYLPNGTRWGVTIAGVGRFEQTAPAWIEIPLFNGTYAYTADPPAGYYAVNGTGEVHMPGGNAGAVLVFTFLPIPPILYDVAIQETGLPSGTSWWFNYTPNRSSGPLTAPGGAALTLGNGSYDYTVSAGDLWTAYPSRGVLVVDGAPTSLRVTFAPAPAYGVTFDPTGLSDSGWNVTVGDRTGSSSSATPIQFDLPNGTYGWSATSLLGAYHAVPSSGSITVAGAPVVQEVVFEPVTYDVTFRPVGLPAGTLWSLDADGMTFGPSSSSSTIVAPLPVGPDVYNASSEDPAYGGVLGVVTVAGPGQTVTVSFPRVEFLITFSELGLPTGSQWGVSVGPGASFALANAGANDSFLLPNGSYPYAVEVPAGFTASPGSGTLNVAGANQTMVIHVGPSETGGSGIGPFSWGELLIGSLLAAVAILLVVLVVTFRRRTRPPP